MMLITGFYAGILSILFIILTFNVIVRRMKYKIGLGDGDNHMMKKAIRVHANFAEHVPLILLMMALCDNAGTSPVVMHGMGITLVISRIIHAIGLMKTSVRSWGRLLGMVGTIAVMVVAAAILILRYVTA